MYTKNLNLYYKQHKLTVLTVLSWYVICLSFFGFLIESKPFQYLFYYFFSCGRPSVIQYWGGQYSYENTYETLLSIILNKNLTIHISLGSQLSRGSSFCIVNLLRYRKFVTGWISCWIVFLSFPIVREHYGQCLSR